MLASRIIRSIAARISKQKSRARKSHESRPAEKSTFGRIPLSTYSLFSSHAKNVSGRIACYLPLNISKELRDFTVKEVLSTLFRDWLENESDEPLSESDIEDFGSFIELSCWLAGALESAEDSAVYRASLQALLQDWLDKWNTVDESGRYYPGDWSCRH